MAVMSSSIEARLRHIQVNDSMPDFVLKDFQGKEFTYHHAQNQVWLFAFIRPDQSQTQKAWNTISNLLKQLDQNEKNLTLVAISTNEISTEIKQSLKDSTGQAFSILYDKDYKLWGQLGVIVSPTFVLVDQNDQVTWIMSGLSFDFESELKKRLWEAFGLIKKSENSEEVIVHALKNNTNLAKMRRHLNMAKLLEKKFCVDAAISEMRKAQVLMPGSVETQIELGQLLCRNGQGKEALEIAEKIDPNNHVEQSAKKFIAGWAHHQLGHLDMAEQFLTEATVLNPKSARVLYELGKVFRAKGKTEKALDAFQLALADIFGDTQPSTTIQD